MAFMKPEIKIEPRMELGSCSIEVQSDGAFAWLLDGLRIRRFHSLASVADGRRLNTRSARRTGIREIAADTPWGEGRTLCIEYSEEDLILEQRLTLVAGKRELIAAVALRDTRKLTETNFLAPLDNPYQMCIRDRHMSIAYYPRTVRL